MMIRRHLANWRLKRELISRHDGVLRPVIEVFKRIAIGLVVTAVRTAGGAI